MPAPAILLTDYESTKTYYEGLCQAHKLTDRLIFGDLNEMENAVKASTKGVSVWLEPWEKTKAGDKNQSNNFLGEKSYTLEFLAKADTDKFTDEHQKYIMLEGIARDFMSKLIKDRNARVICINLTSYEYGRGDDRLFGATKYISCILQVNHFATEDTEYKTANWN